MWVVSYIGFASHFSFYTLTIITLFDTSQCMQYFAKLTKYGSVNAKPVYFFMLTIKGPSFESFNKATDAYSEAGMAHLEAMAREHYASFLYKQHNQDDIANNHITVSYWLYQDWGAHAK